MAVAPLRMGAVMPRVFLSYAQESDTHKAQVRQLRDLLVEAGIDAVLDQVHAEEVGQDRERDWPGWCLDQIKLADFVLVVVSAAYKRRADSPQHLPEDEGRGVHWEARRLRDIIYDGRERASKVLPVLLPGGVAVYVPELFNLGQNALVAVDELTADGVRELVGILLGQRPLPAGLAGKSSTGWVYAGANAGRAGAEVVREHIQLRARGQRALARGGDLFKGRVRALKAIGDWLQVERPPGQVLVVTGQPGAGKSAVVARVALALEPAGLAEDRELGLVFHARTATLADLLHAIAVTTHTRAAETISDMLDRISQATPPSGGIWRIVVDALDEAASTNERDSLADALAALGALPAFRVVVATRALATDEANRFGPSALLSRLGVGRDSNVNLVDLDNNRFFEPLDLAEFASAVLRQDGATAPAPGAGAWRRYRTDAELVGRLAMAVAGRAGRNYLVAALTADPLSRHNEVVDPSAPGFKPSSLPASVGEALAKYLNQLPPVERENVRGLLTALAYARGIGVDDDQWTAFASALGFPVSAAYLGMLRHGAAADYLLQSSTVEQGRVTRLFHQALADELLHDRPRLVDEAKILGCLVPATPSGWEDAGDYARTFAANHAQAAGRLGELLADPVYPSVAELTRLLAVLPADLAGESAAVAAALQMLAGRARTLEPGAPRAGLLALTCAHLGLPELTRRYRRTGQPLIGWAHSRGRAYQTLAGLQAWALALGRIRGREVVVSGDHGTVRIWDAATGTPIGDPLTGHEGPVRAVVIARSGDLDVVVSGGKDATVRLWNAATGKPIGDPLTGHTHPVNTVAVGRAGDRDIVVSGSEDATVRMWDIATGTPVGDPLVGHLDPIPPEGVLAVAVGRVGDCDLIVAGSGFGTVWVWDAATGMPVGGPLEHMSGSVNAVAMGRSGDRDVIVSGGVISDNSLDQELHDGEVVVWDAATRNKLYALRTPGTGRVLAVATRRIGDLDMIVSGSDDGMVRRWDATTRKPIGDPFAGHTDAISAVVMGRIGDREVIISGGNDNTVRWWDATSAELAGGPISGHTRLVKSVATGRIGAREVIVSGSDDGTVRLWDAATGSAAGEPLSQYVPVRAVATGRIGHRDVVVSGSAATEYMADYDNYGDGMVRIWDAATGASIGDPLIDHTGAIFGVAIGRVRNRDVIVTGSTGSFGFRDTFGDHNGTVRVWDVVASTPIGDLLAGHTDVAGTVAVGRIGGLDVIVSGSKDGTAQVWDATAGTPIGDPLRGHDGPVYAVVMSRVGDRDVIVTGGEDKTLRLWDAATGAPIGNPLTGHSGPVYALATGRIGDVATIVSGSADATIRIWAATSGATIAMQATLDPVEAVAFKGDRVSFAAGIAVGTITLAHLG
ncbi:TIR domain-containing protein [Dactylosporangium sp. NPDC049525]|uniref:TIR domain-containing protein n=1 Tax=Dactylosporangium sp. NPDC049525 TaxID=3154730 RepID=UPI0034487814